MTEQITQASPSLPPGARCAVHPEKEANATCERCGNFMCAGCAADGGPKLCLACRMRGGVGLFPYTRDHYSLDGLMNLALSRFKENWAVLCAAFGTLLFVTYGLTFVGGLVLRLMVPSLAESWGAMVGMQVTQTLVSVCGDLIVLGLCLDVLEAKPLDMAKVFARAWRLPSALGSTLITLSAMALYAGIVGGGAWLVGGVMTFGPGFWVLIGGVLLGLFPAVYLGIGVAFVMLELVHNPEATLFSAYRTSWQLVEDKRGSVALIMTVAGLIAFAGFFACVVGMVASMPLGALLFGGLFLALKNPGAGTQAFVPSPEFRV